MALVQLTVRLDSEVAGFVRARAAAEGCSMSEVVNELLLVSSREMVSPSDGFEVILPALQAGVANSIQKSVDGLNSRLKHLMSRALVASLANRFMVYQLLALDFGEDGARRIYDEAMLEAEKRLAPLLERLGVKLGEG